MTQKRAIAVLTRRRNHLAFRKKGRTDDSSRLDRDEMQALDRVLETLVHEEDGVTTKGNDSCRS